MIKEDIEEELKSKEKKRDNPASNSNNRFYILTSRLIKFQNDKTFLKFRE